MDWTNRFYKKDNMYIMTCLYNHAAIFLFQEYLWKKIVALINGPTNQTLLKKSRPKTADISCKSYILQKNNRLNIIALSKITAAHE